MDSQTQTKLEQCIDEIGEILFLEAIECNPESIQTLEGIEKTVRSLTQEYVLPKLGIFLSTASQTPPQEKNGL